MEEQLFLKYTSLLRRNLAVEDNLETPPGQMDKQTWKWVITMSPQLKNTNADGSQKDQGIHGFGHSSAGVSEASGALVLCMVLFLLVSTVYLLYRVYYMENKRLTQHWLHHHRPSQCPCCQQQKNLDRGSKQLENSIGNINTSNALVDPESNRKNNKRDPSFKSKNSQSNNASNREDQLVHERDINLEIVGEEDKEEDNSINVPEQYNQDDQESEEEEESDEEEQEQDQQAQQQVANRSASYSQKQKPQKNPQEQEKPQKDNSVNKSKSINNQSQNQSLNNSSKQASNTSQLSKKQKELVEAEGSQVQQDQSYQRQDNMAGPYNPKLEKSGISRKSRGSAKNAKSPSQQDDEDAYGDEYYDEEDDDNRDQQQQPEQFQSHQE